MREFSNYWENRDPVREQKWEILVEGMQFIEVGEKVSNAPGQKLHHTKKIVVQSMCIENRTRRRYIIFYEKNKKMRKKPYSCKKKKMRKNGKSRLNVSYSRNFFWKTKENRCWGIWKTSTRFGAESISDIMYVHVYNESSWCLRKKVI